MSDLDSLYQQIKEDEVRRLSSVLALVFLGTGVVLSVVGAALAWHSVWLGLFVLGIECFIVGILIGRE